MPLEVYRDLQKLYAGCASNYDQRWARYHSATLERALEAIPLNGAASLLDVACGTGILAEKLRDLRPRLQVTGVDVSPDMIEQARRRIPPVEGNGAQWRVGHAENLPVESGGYDIITCTSAFHLIRDASAALAEFRRALKLGGALVIVDWCRDFLSMKALAAGLSLRSHHPRQIRTLREMRSLLERSGLAVVSANRFKATPLWGMMTIVSRSA